MKQSRRSQTSPTAPFQSENERVLEYLLSLEARVRMRLKSAQDEGGPRKVQLTASKFEAQRRFLDDGSKFKAARCTRRAGKSYADALMLFESALNHPGASVLYLGITFGSAKRIMWKDCVKAVNRRHKIGGVPNESELTMTLPNGSVIYLAGADSNEKEMEKLLGQKYPLIVIDEAQSWKQDLNHLVYNILKPCVADYEGQIVMTGTPNNVKRGLFYDVTTGKEPGWSAHEWTAFDNPYMRDKWDREIQDLMARKPGIEHTPGFKQNYLNEWCVDESSLVYKFDSQRNQVAETPNHRTNRDGWQYVIGVDLGYSPDPTAFVVMTFQRFDKALYVIDCHKEHEMIPSVVAARIKHYLSKYPNAHVVMDAANLQAVEEMRQRHQLPIKAAEKHGKPGFIALMNDDIVRGVVKLCARADDLADEWSQLVWEDEARKKEDPRCENHLSDAALYAWRYAFNYLSEDRPQPEPDGDEADEFWSREAERIRPKADPLGGAI